MRVSFFPKREISEESLKKALKILTPKERREFLECLRSGKSLNKPGHKIILHPNINKAKIKKFAEKELKRL